MASVLEFLFVLAFCFVFLSFVWSFSFESSSAVLSPVGFQKLWKRLCLSKAAMA